MMMMMIGYWRHRVIRRPSIPRLNSVFSVTL